MPVRKQCQASCLCLAAEARQATAEKKLKIGWAVELWQQRQACRAVEMVKHRAWPAEKTAEVKENALGARLSHCVAACPGLAASSLVRCCLHSVLDSPSQCKARTACRRHLPSMLHHCAELTQHERGSQRLRHDAGVWPGTPQEVSAADTCVTAACGCPPAPLRGEAVASLHPASRLRVLPEWEQLLQAQ